MSQIEVKSTSSDSEGTGLTFVRPLPGNRTLQDVLRTPPISPGEKAEFASLLFPPRIQEDSGSLPTVTGIELGHFVLEERIGRGGMGAVFRAIDRRLNRVVALKILSPDLSSDPDAVQRFQNEARAAAKLDHDNIARVHYIGEENGLHFIAFEFVTGTNVREFILQKGRLSPESVVNYTLQIAEALRHTAAANVVHRDIKPSNIIVSPVGRAKLVDLGLARHQPANQIQDLTVAGTALGTFDYIAPEQAIDARNVDVRSDIYSLGCTMFHMLTGEPPYPKGTMFQKVMNHHGPTPPEVRLKNPQVSVQLSRVVQKMMASNPDERYVSPDALIHDLIQIAESLNLTPTFPEAVVWTTPLFKARNQYWDGTRTWMAVALVLLLFVYLVDRLQFGNRQQIAGKEESNLIENGPEQTPAEPAVNLAPISSDGNSTSTATTTLTTNSNVPSTVPPDPGSNSGTVFSESLGGIPSTDFTGNEWTAIGASEQTTKFWNSLGNFGQPDNENTIATPLTQPGRTTTTQATPLPAQVIPEVKTLPFVVTQSKTGKIEEVATLAEAFALAMDHSAIEIQVDGLLPVQKTSIQFASKRVILRAAEHFHPVIRFELSEELTLRPLANSAAMFDIGNGGALEVYEVGLELVVDPKTTVDEWTIVKLAPGAEFGARWCSFTMINPEFVSASFVLAPSSEPADISNLMPERMSGRASAVRIRDSICRGEMDGIKQFDLHPLEVLFEETAVSFSGTFHRINGSNFVETNMSTESVPSTSMSLIHVTAILGEGLLDATTGDHGTLEPILINIRNSVIKIDQSQQAVVSLSGHLDEDVLKEKIQWQPSLELSFVQTQGPLFTIESSASFLFEPEVIPQKEFGATLVQVSSDGISVSSGLGSSTPWHAVQKGAFLLHNVLNTETNPALKSSSDGRNAGVDWTRSGLPKLRTLSENVGLQLDSSKIEF